MLAYDFLAVVIVISGQSMTVSSRNKPVNTVLQAQIVVSQVKYCCSIMLRRSVANLSVSWLLIGWTCVSCFALFSPIWCGCRWRPKNARESKCGQKSKSYFIFLSYKINSLIKLFSRYPCFFEGISWWPW